MMMIIIITTITSTIITPIAIIHQYCSCDSLELGFAPRHWHCRMNCLQPSQFATQLDFRSWWSFRTGRVQEVKDPPWVDGNKSRLVASTHQTMTTRSILGTLAYFMWYVFRSEIARTTSKICTWEPNRVAATVATGQPHSLLSCVRQHASRRSSTSCPALWSQWPANFWCQMNL